MRATHRRFETALAIGLGLFGLEAAAGEIDRQPAIIVLAMAEPGSADANLSESAVSRAIRPASTNRTARSMLPVWTPRVSRGRPAAREGGASRSAGQQLVLRTLVPRLDETGLTLSPEPSLFFEILPATPYDINFTLLDPDAIDPLVDVMLAGPFDAGIHRVDLAEHGIQLQVGRRYEWYVAVVPDPERRSADTIARGVLLRITEPDLERQISAADTEEVAPLLAKAGVWYDALASLGDRLAAHPDADAPRLARKALLEQAGIGAIDQSPH